MSISHSTESVNEIKQNTPGINYSLFQNVDVLKELEEIYNEGLILFEEENYLATWKVFKYMYDNDLSLKKRILRVLSPENDILVSEKELKEMIELQGFFSNFRISLLETISTRLVNLYDEALKYAETDFKKSSSLAIKAKDIYRYFTNKLQEYENSDDHHQIQMYKTSMETLTIVKESGERFLSNLQDIYTDSGEKKKASRRKATSRTVEASKHVGTQVKSANTENLTTDGKKSMTISQKIKMHKEMNKLLLKNKE